MKSTIYFVLIAGLIGFVVAAYVATANPPWMTPTLAYILCPPGIVAGIMMTDPDTERIWLFFGPLNALIYGAVGFALWRLFRSGHNSN